MPEKKKQNKKTRRLPPELRTSRHPRPMILPPRGYNATMYTVMSPRELSSHLAARGDLEALGRGLPGLSLSTWLACDDFHGNGTSHGRLGLDGHTDGSDSLAEPEATDLSNHRCDAGRGHDEGRHFSFV